MQVRKLGPGNGNHLGRCIQLHGARAQWNHAAVQCQVFIGQTAQITQHIGFGMNTGKNRMRQNSRLPGHTIRHKNIQFGIKPGHIRRLLLNTFGNHIHQLLKIFQGNRFIQRHGKTVSVRLAHINLRIQGRVDHLCRQGVFYI